VIGGTVVLRKNFRPERALSQQQSDKEQAEN
jgi:hypothetical protein